MRDTPFFATLTVRQARGGLTLLTMGFPMERRSDRSFKVWGAKVMLAFRMLAPQKNGLHLSEGLAALCNKAQDPTDLFGETFYNFDPLGTSETSVQVRTALLKGLERLAKQLGTWLARDQDQPIEVEVVFHTTPEERTTTRYTYMEDVKEERV